MITAEQAKAKTHCAKLQSMIDVVDMDIRKACEYGESTIEYHTDSEGVCAIYYYEECFNQHSITQLGVDFHNFIIDNGFKCAINENYIMIWW